MSQSPLIGAFVPGISYVNLVVLVYSVSIPSDRGIRSGNFRKPVHVGHVKVSIPSDRGIRSGPFSLLLLIMDIICLNPL